MNDIIKELTRIESGIANIKPPASEGELFVDMRRMARTLKAVLCEIDYWAATPDTGEGAAMCRGLRHKARQAWENKDGK